MAKIYLICILTLTFFALKGQCQTKAFRNVMKYVDTLRNIPNGGNRVNMRNLEQMMKDYKKETGTSSGRGARFGDFGNMGRSMGGMFRGFGASSSGFMDGGFGSDYVDGYGDMASGGMDMASGGFDMMSGGPDMGPGGVDISY